MEAPELEGFMRRMKNDIINRHDAKAAARYYAEDFRTLNPIPGRAPGLPGLTAGLGEFFRAFPDAQETVEDVVSNGDQVAAVSTIRATHKGPFAGIPPTGRRVEVHIFELHRVSEGKITEGWVFLDMIALLSQLGTPARPSGR